MGAAVGKAKESAIKQLAKVKARLQFRPFEKKEWLDISPEEKTWRIMERAVTKTQNSLSNGASPIAIG